VILGKTVTTEYAYYKPGKTKNPHDPTRTPGGSSSGSAAAVAASMVPAALGTQTGGSVIRPAAFCGIYGFKPTYRRTDLDGVKELARSFDTVGWMARAVEDLDLLARVLLLDYKAPAPSKLRVAVCRTPFDDQMQPEAVAALNDIAQALDATEVKLPGNFIELDDAHHTIVAAEAAKAFRREYADFRGQLSDQLRAMLELGLSSSAGTVQTAQGKAVAARTALQRIHRFDALLTASAPGEAPPKSEGTGNAVFSRFWSLLHVPCATLPVASGPSGLPVGVQFVGRPGEDEALIATAIAAAKKLRLY
jgi:Asp-tRNA(Asn)/Glu-tRNA(Gln) amidotransferase A subunit family amidase